MGKFGVLVSDGIEPFHYAPATCGMTAWYQSIFVRYEPRNRLPIIKTRHTSTGPRDNLRKFHRLQSCVVVGRPMTKGFVLFLREDSASQYL